MAKDHHGDSPLFVEIRPSSKVPAKPDLIEVWTSSIDPQKCKALLKDLSKVSSKDEALAHLKRVKRRQPDTGSPRAKKQKVDLQVLLGRENDAVMKVLVETYGLTVQRTLVPGRPAESKQELDEFNAIWPTIFFQKNSEEHKEQELALTEEEMLQMERGMKLALEDGGAVILNPVTGVVVSKSQDELLLQLNASRTNPLCTPVLLALQGVSRVERKAALGHGMDSDAFRNGQYLSTGYDIYLPTEPNVFEAMALVHSRIRRVVFGVVNQDDGGIGGTGEASAVHCLPGTNHRYRAFVCSTQSLVQNHCRQTD